MADSFGPETVNAHVKLTPFTSFTPADGVGGENSGGSSLWTAWASSQKLARVFAWGYGAKC